MRTLRSCCALLVAACATDDVSMDVSFGAAGAPALPSATAEEQSRAADEPIAPAPENPRRDIAQLPAAPPAMDAPREQAADPVPPAANDPQPEPQRAMSPAEDECEYHELLAREDASGAPFRVGTDLNDTYRCFAFDIGLEGPAHALAFYPQIDNAKIVHHFLLYAQDDIDSSKVVSDCSELSASAAVMVGWAPGSGDWVLPQDVGLDLQRGRFLLEVHYSNVTDAEQTDRSGMKVCTTRKLRPNTASVSWLGNQLFAVPPHVKDFQVQGRCAPTLTQPVHVLRSWPHMHLLGKRMSMRLDRANGTRESVFDVEFSFGDQRHYDTPLVLQPGDSLLTSCYFDNPSDRVVGIGTKTTDEMCHNFVIAYPAGALTTQGFLKNSCIGLP